MAQPTDTEQTTRPCVSIVSLHLKIGGIERAVCSLANLLCADYDVEILSIYKLSDEPAFALDERVRVVYLSEGLAPNKQEFLDALHAHRPFSILREGLRAVGVLWKRRRCIKQAARRASGQIIISTRDLFHRALAKAHPRRMLIAWEHNDLREDPRGTSRLMRSIKGFDYFVPVSPGLATFFEPQVPAPTHCVYLPLSIDKLPPERAIEHAHDPASPLQITAVGRLEPEKAYDDLLRVFALVYAHHAGTTLALVGEGSQRATLEALAQKLGIAEAVTFYGARYGEELQRLYEESALFVSTSHRESFGQVLLEAMAHGVACLSFSSAAGPREIIEDGVNGYLTSGRDQAILAEKIIELLESPDKRARLAYGARATAAAYAASAVRETWLAFCREALVELPKKTTVVFVSSAGGHFAELRALAPLYERYNSYYVSEKNASMESYAQIYGDRLFFLAYGTKERPLTYPFIFAFNCVRSLWLFWRLKPDFTISTGAHTAVPLCYLTHLLGRRVIYFETYANINTRSLAGRLIAPIADLFFVQWEEMLALYPRAIYRGWLP